MKKTGFFHIILHEGMLKMFGIPVMFIVFFAFLSGCTKSEIAEDNTDNILPTVKSVTPSNESDSVPTVVALTVTFSEKMDTTTIDNSTFTLRRGALVIDGTVTCTDTTATFKPSQELEGNTLYTMTVKQGVRDIAGNEISGQYMWSFTTAAPIDNLAPFVTSVAPSANATSVSTGSKLTVTFSEEIENETVSTASFIVKTGTLVVSGSIEVSGNIVSFTPSNVLASGTQYNITLKKEIQDAAGNSLTSDFTWSFTTMTETTPPAVASVLPLANATNVQINIKPSVTFTEPMSNSTINTSTFLLKKGSTAIAGTVSVSGNTATFTPSVALSANSQYTATVTDAVKDASGIPMSAVYTWSFTTGSIADATPPAVSSVNPAANATGVQTNIKPSVTFSEPMDNATINSTNIVIKAGSVNVPGSVSTSGNVATFTPATALTGNTVYTVSISTGVKDVAGNSMASTYTWTFTTVSSAPVQKSFYADVAPILNKCNECHTHKWTPSSNASTFHANLVSSGHINLTTPTSGKIYQKVNGGHPSSGVTAEQKTTVLTWIKEGSKNN